MTKRALITGVTGQDGSYLADLLLAKGYEVYGIARQVSTIYGEQPRISHLMRNKSFHLHEGDITNYGSIVNAVGWAAPDEVYHLAAHSWVPGDPFCIWHTNTHGTQCVLEAVRTTAPLARFYFAGSSEQFGNQPGLLPYHELSAFKPMSTYAASKVTGWHLAHYYRRAYGMKVWCGLLFNHESPRRSPQFVTRKITQGLARVKAGKQQAIALGSTKPTRDWGHAKDYVRAMHSMLQMDEPQDFVIATGEEHTVDEFLTVALTVVDLKSGCVYHNPDFVRDNEVHRLVGDPARAQAILGWEPTVSFDELVKEMMLADMAREGL